MEKTSFAWSAVWKIVSKLLKNTKEPKYQLPKWFRGDSSQVNFIRGFFNLEVAGTSRVSTQPCPYLGEGSTTAADSGARTCDCPVTLGIIRVIACSTPSCSGRCCPVRKVANAPRSKEPSKKPSKEP